jgi:hypothetical protein
MTKDQIQAEIQSVDEMTSLLLDRRPDDEDLLRVKTGLEAIRQMVARKWPLSAEDRKQVNIGLYAVRVLEGGPYDRLPDALLTLSADLKAV